MSGKRVVLLLMFLIFASIFVVGCDDLSPGQDDRGGILITESSTFSVDEVTNNPHQQTVTDKNAGQTFKVYFYGYESEHGQSKNWVKVSGPTQLDNVSLYVDNQLVQYVGTVQIAADGTGVAEFTSNKSGTAIIKADLLQENAANFNLPWGLAKKLTFDSNSFTINPSPHIVIKAFTKAGVPIDGNNPASKVPAGEEFIVEIRGYDEAGQPISLNFGNNNNSDHDNDNDDNDDNNKNNQGNHYGWDNGQGHGEEDGEGDGEEHGWGTQMVFKGKGYAYGRCRGKGSSQDYSIDGSLEVVDPAQQAAFSQLTPFHGMPDGMSGQATAVFNDVGTIQLTFVNDDQIPSSSGPVGKFVADHFAWVGSPVLTLDSGSKWAYIGENMTLDLTLQAIMKNGNPAPSYKGEEFKSSYEGSVVPGLNLKLNGDPNNKDYTDRLDISDLVVDGSLGDGKVGLKATVTLKRDSTLQYKESLSNLNFSLQPKDGDGVTLAQPDTTSFLGYSFFGGRIHVVGGGLYNTSTVPVKIQVERWDGAKFTVNTLDSKTIVTSGSFSPAAGSPSLQVEPKTLTFANGMAGLNVTNNAGSNVTVRLVPNSGVPGYLDFLSDQLSWGVVPLDGPGIDQKQRIIYEKEEVSGDQ